MFHNGVAQVPGLLHLYYIKGKDMVLSDFLSRQTMDDSNPHELIPISFSLRDWEVIIFIALIMRLSYQERTNIWYRPDLR